MAAPQRISEHLERRLRLSPALIVRARGRINAISPGQVATPMWGLSTDGDHAGDAPVMEGLIPLGQMARPDEVAHAVLYLVSDVASYLTGEAPTIDGGMMAGFSFLIPTEQSDS